MAQAGLARALLPSAVESRSSTSSRSYAGALRRPLRRHRHRRLQRGRLVAVLNGHAPPEQEEGGADREAGFEQGRGEVRALHENGPGEAEAMSATSSIIVLGQPRRF